MQPVHDFWVNNKQQIQTILAIHFKKNLHVMVDNLAKHIGGLIYWVHHNLLQSPQNQCDRYHHLHRHCHYHQNHCPLGGQVHRTLVNHPPKQEITKRMNMC